MNLLIHSPKYARRGCINVACFQKVNDTKLLKYILGVFRFPIITFWGHFLGVVATMAWGGEWHYLVPFTTLAVRRDALQPASPPSSEGERRRPSSHQASIPGLPWEARMMPWSPTSLVHPLTRPPFHSAEPNLGRLLICVDLFFFCRYLSFFCSRTLPGIGPLPSQLWSNIIGNRTILNKCR